VSIRRTTHVVVAVVLALALVPAVAAARPATDGPGTGGGGYADPAPSAPVTRTIVNEDAPTLPVVLAGAALVVALSGAAFQLAGSAGVRRRLRAVRTAR
jgi:hypothetical protein